MSTIEERVVAMKFDNAQFERGVYQTLKSLEALNKGLKLDGATKGLNDISAASKNIQLGHIVTAVDGIANKFKALSAIGVTALATIAHKAVSTGLQMVKSLTINPIRSGLAEYETNLNSIQTILANTAWQKTGLNDVNKALQILNEYSDQTIYNFAEMARNIGTFTAAGRISLMDWNSVVNAGLGGKVFQDELMETARVNGVAIDQMLKDAGSFRNTLEKGWLTSDILTQTLAKFTGDLNAAQ